MNKAFLMLIFVFVVPCVAAELIIEPQGFDGTIYIGKPIKEEITLKNTFAFTLHNINFTPMDYATIPKIDTLLPNETKKINISIETTNTFSQRDFNSVVKFWYYSDINLDPQTYHVNITNTSFEPETINIKVGDSIVFKNLAPVYASVKDDASPYKYFDKIVQPNQSVTVNGFTVPDTIPYTDWNLIKKGTIVVNNISQELTNNADYNKIFTLKLVSKYQGSELKAELYPYDNLTMEYNEFQEVNLRIWNDGNETIFNISINFEQNKDWFVTEDNHFDLTKNQNRYINIKITPDINNTNSTNMTYSIDVVAEGLNSNKVSNNLKIFIPYADEIQKIYYGEDFWKGKREFCNDFPNALECNPPPKVEKVIVIEYRNSTIEYTKEEALKNDRETNKRLSANEANDVKIIKSINTLTETVASVVKNLDNVSTTIKNSNHLSIEAKKESETQLRTVLLLFLLLLIIAGGAYFIHYLKWKKRQEMNTSG